MRKKYSSGKWHESSWPGVSKSTFTNSGVFPQLSKFLPTGWTLSTHFINFSEWRHNLAAPKKSAADVAMQPRSRTRSLPWLTPRERAPLTFPRLKIFKLCETGGHSSVLIIRKRSSDWGPSYLKVNQKAVKVNVSEHVWPPLLEFSSFSLWAVLHDGNYHSGNLSSENDETTVNIRLFSSRIADLPNVIFTSFKESTWKLLESLHGHKWLILASWSLIEAWCSITWISPFR